MKKLIPIILAGAMLLSLTACGGSAASAQSKAGTQNNSSTVDQVLSDAAGTPAPTETPAPQETAPISDETPAEDPYADIPDAPLSYDSPVVETGAPVDIDLTRMSATLVYSQVYDMMNSPLEFVGKTVRMEGPAASATSGEITYYAVIIEDATACCQQGLEYVLCAGETYPEDYVRTTVTGEFGIYKEGNYIYAVLNGARVEA